MKCLFFGPTPCSMPVDARNLSQLFKGELMRTSKVSSLVAFLGTAVLSTGIGAQPSPADLRQQMVGTWLLAEQWVEQDGRKIQRFGTNPKGIAFYDGRGRFSTIILRSDLPKFASNNAMTGTADENKAIVQGSNATYGTWSVSDQDGSLTSQVDASTFPGWDGQTQRRSVAIVGDEMKICVPGAQIGGTACAIWKRAK
jgi:Lipocalin-like domain